MRPGLTLILVLASTVLASSCFFPGSFTLGNVGSPTPPWQFRTQYAFWDSTAYRAEDAHWKREDRPDDEGGKILRLRLHGFMFNPNRDRRTWTSEEWQHYYHGLDTQPFLDIEVLRADKVKPNDSLEYTVDTSNPSSGGGNGEDPALTVEFQPGSPILTPLSTYPDDTIPYGSKITAKLTINNAPESPGPLGYVAGNLDYEVEKGSNDPDDVVTGKFSVRFSALLVGERLAECNDSLTPRGPTHNASGAPSPCENLDPGAPGP